MFVTATHGFHGGVARQIAPIPSDSYDGDVPPTHVPLLVVPVWI